MQAIL